MTTPHASNHAVEMAWSTQRKKLQSQAAANPLSLLVQYKANPSIRLRNKIVMLNMGLLRVQAKKWADQCSEPLEDLVNEGVLGLIKAVDAFDPSMGNAFSSFAVPFISGAIQHYMRDKAWGTVRPPRRAVETYASVHKTQRTLAQQGRDLPVEQVAEGIGLSKARWRFVKEAREQPPVISLDEEPLQLSTDGPEVEEDLSWIYGHIEALSEPTCSCIVERFLGGRSAQEIAKRHSLNEAAVVLLIETGLEQIRFEIASKGRPG